MRRIAFRIPLCAAEKLDILPDPTMIKRHSTMNGLSEFIEVSYLFEYAPQSWKEAQLIATIKHGISKLIPESIFVDTYSDEVQSKLWMISDLIKHFSFVKFPKPLFPKEKAEIYKNLCLHAKKLHLEGLLYYEQLEATAIRFNNAKGRPYSQREIMKKAKAAFTFAEDHKEEWAVRLSKSDLKLAHQRGGSTRGKQTSAKAVENQQLILKFLPKCTKPNGKPDIEMLCELTGFSRPTIYKALR